MTHELNIKEFPRIEANYRFIRASEQDIAEAIVQHANAKFWTVGEALRSLRENGDAVRVWFDILRAGLPEFASMNEYHNLVPAVLRNAMATLISGTTVAPTFKANYMALGSGSTPPTNADVALETETIRGTFGNRYAVDNIAFLNKFFTQGEVAGETFNEAGIFVDGTGAADSGWLLSRVLMNESIGATETLTVNASITISG